MKSLNFDKSISLKKFNLHNRKFFFKNKKPNKKVFLIEFNGWQVIHIIFSYLINHFKNEKNCKIIAYECFDLLNRFDPPWYKKYLWKIGSSLYLKTFKTFKTFGTDKFIKPSYNNDIQSKAKFITKKFFKKDPQLTDLENFKVNGVWIGDLIYDSYLKKYLLATINIKSPVFINFFNDTIKLFLFWENFFSQNKVEGICVCHAIYITGIPLRIANYKRIKCFSISNMNLINLTKSISYKKKSNGSDIQFKYFNEIFNKLPKETKKKYLIKGKKILNDFTSGKKKYFYLKKNTYKNKIRIIKNPKKSKLKVIIFSHDFLDSPHVYGNHFFPDFKEWFKFLDKIIKNTDYEWYIKYHPQSSSVTKKEIDELIKNNENIKLINKNITNDQLYKIGVKFVLTVYGSVGSELPAYGINVINASNNNPHFNYNFCINPKSVKEYEKILLNLNNIKNKIKLNDLYFFHFMKYLVFEKNLFFKKPSKYFVFLKEKPLQYTNKIYEYWLKDFNIDRHNHIVKNLKNFIKSNDYFFLDINYKK